MTKRRTVETLPAVPQPLPGPHVIHEHAVYAVSEAQAALRLRASTIRREIRMGRLRVSKRAGRYYILGAWLLAWIEAGEIRRKKATATESLNGVY